MPDIIAQLRHLGADLYQTADRLNTYPIGSQEAIAEIMLAMDALKKCAASLEVMIR